MDFIDQLRSISQRAEKQLGRIKTEEATKNALVMPFINALGYNVFDPTEVIPEFTADVGVKKGEKVDYAIMKDGKVIVLVECKAANVELEDVHTSQLYRYFSVTDARIAVLTNGLDYRFYSDLEEPNRMDSKAFLEFNLLDFSDSIVPELKKLTQPSFDIDTILSTAGDLKYTKEMKRILNDQLTAPSEEFVLFLTSRVYSGVKTKKVKKQFAEITKRALKQFINDHVNERLKSALESPEEAEGQVVLEPKETKEDIVTTEEEQEGYHIVKSILRQHVEPSRVGYKDFRTYFNILLDGKSRQPLCRLWFNSPKKKWIGLFDQDKKEERVLIKELNDIYTHADRIIAALKLYE